MAPETRYSLNAFLIPCAFAIYIKGIVLMPFSASVSTMCLRWQPAAVRQYPALPPEIPPDPFTSVRGLGEKQVVTFSGDSAGHDAGVRSEFMLELDNRVADERWQGEYCVLLLDRDRVVMEIAHHQFDIPAGVKTHTPVTVQFPVNTE